MATIAENIQTLRSIKSDIKQAITDKGGSVGNDFKIYAQAITDLPSGGGGGTENEDALVEGTISEYYNDRVSVVGPYAFAYYSTLTSVNLTNCLSVYTSAFYRCLKLTSVNLPLCKYIGGSAFYECSKLISFNLSLCESIYNSAFCSCQSLSSINLPNCRYIGQAVFSDCKTLHYVNLPNCLKVSTYAFTSCLALQTIKLPNCSYLSNYAFWFCSNLTQVYLNRVSRVTIIKAETFSGCPNLTSVYVPASLVNAFKTAPNWSSISNKIVAYREAIEENPGGGGPIIN